MSAPKIWFITGASSGFGLSVINHVLSKGDIAVATLRKPEVLSDLSTRYTDSQLLVLKLDVTKEDEIRSAFHAAETKFGRIDVVYNNAGYPILSELEGTPNNVARDMFEVNFWGASTISREAVRCFRDVNKPAGGCLLQASSGAGAFGVPGLGYYSASKFALEGFSEALSQEVLPSWNIKIIILQFGAFRTRIAKPESMVTIPLHQSYDGSKSTYTRAFFAGPIDNSQDSDKAAREIYKIANDHTAPLHIPLGLDSLSIIKDKIEIIKKDVKEAEKWSIDLK
ncbi:NAD(P)-binding protein [Cyathus striatus]|nr:NAD(P)-binding protein [Cyathus striatus]